MSSCANIASFLEGLQCPALDEVQTIPFFRGAVLHQRSVSASMLLEEGPQVVVAEEGACVVLRGSLRWDAQRVSHQNTLGGNWEERVDTPTCRKYNIHTNNRFLHVIF